MRKYTPYLLLSLLPIGLFLYLFHAYAINVPLWDDHAIRAFVPTFEKATFSEKIRLLFAQHNEHRIALTRLTAWVLTRLTGQLNFIHLMMVGNAFLFLTWLLMVYVVQKMRMHPSLILFTALLLFSTATAENSFWGMAAVQNFGVVLLAITAFFYLSKATAGNKKPRHLVVALLLGLAALVTSGNGVLVALLGVGYLLFKRSFRQALIWGVGMGAGVGLHAATYLGRPDPVGPTQLSAANAFKGLLLLSGSSSDAGWLWPQEAIRQGQVMAVGAVILLFITVYLLRWLVYRLQITPAQRPVADWLALSLLFLGGTMAATVLSRIGLGLPVFLTSKYKLYSLLSICLATLGAWLWLPDTFKKINARFILVTAAFIYVTNLITEYQFIRNQHLQRWADVMNWQEAAADKKYEPYPYQLPASLQVDNKQNKNIFQNTSLIDSLSKNAGKIRVVAREWDAASQPTFAVLRTGEKTHYFPIFPTRNQSKKRLIFSYFTGGFVSEFSRDELPAGTYELYVMTKNETQTAWYATGRSVVLSPPPARQQSAVQSNW